MTRPQEDVRWQQRFQNYRKALASLNKIETQAMSEVEEMALVKAFEYTFELAWKTLQDYLTLLGYDIHGPRPVLREAISIGLIAPDNWLQMLEDRNYASHAYDDQEMKLIRGRISEIYRPLLNELDRTLEEKVDESN